MRAIYKGTVTVVSYFFMVLFVYAAVSKMRDFENFQVQLAQSPLLSAYAGFISYGVIALELVIAGVLAFPKARRVGLYASFGLMVAFSVYIDLILNYSDFVPCSCGGILEKMSWDEHLIFNGVCVVLALITSVFMGKERAHGWSRIAAAALIAVFSAGSMVALFLSSEYIMKKENNFTRRFIPHPIVNEQALDLKSNSFYFAGNTGDTLFLGNTQAPLLLATIGPHFKKIDFDTLQISDYQLPFKNVQLDVNYPYYSISDGTVPVLFEGKFPNKSAQNAGIGKLYFSTIRMTSPNHYIFQATLTENLEDVLGVLNTKTQAVEIRPNILEKQMDGLFDTDGDFQLERANNRFIYTYYYRNQYITSDLELNNRSTGNTIDTVKTAQVHITELSDGKTKMSSPPLQVNQVQAVFGNRLYNVSKLRGRYESRNRWKEAKVVDVYNYENKSYEYSFYVYHRNGSKMRNLLVSKNYLYVVAGNEIVRFERRR